jgi:predicted RND superfamily exporter protein
MKTKQSLPHRFFIAVTAKPKTIMVLAFLIIIATAAFIPTLTIDSRSEAFLPEDDPALLYRDHVEETFGLKDPMVIAVVNKAEHGIFNPQSLQLIQWLTDEVMKIPEINRDRVVSLATEDNITGNEEGMLVEKFYKNQPETQDDADSIRKAVMDFPLYLGSLVARDGSSALIVTEVYDVNEAPKVYEKLLALVERAPTHGEELHVAGDGAVSGYLVTYINADSARLVPISVLIITLLCILSFRTWRGVLIPTVIILSATASALGLMAAAGVPIYVITTSMPILLVGVAVADSIHVLSQYYEELASHPEKSQRELVVRTMELMWRPVTVTTLTSMIGFLGISISSFMPPMQAFGLFSLIGLGVAGLFSLTFVPAALVILKPVHSSAFKTSGPDIFSRTMDKLGGWVLGHTKTVIFLAFIVCVGGVIGALKLEVNESWVENFRTSEPIYLADVAINETLDGSNTLDIMIETANKEDIFKPENLRRIDALQSFLTTLPHVNGSTSIVDYIKQMNRSLNENKASEYRIPDDVDLISQYFLLYSASGDPTDFEEEVDYDYQMALVRARLDSARYQQSKVVVEEAQKYIDYVFNSEGIKATLSGRVNVDYHWLDTLLGTQFKSVLFALVLVWLLVCASLRSLYGGTLAIIPVVLACLSVYAFMGVMGITLAVGTSMTAAIALGIGVDFSIHTLDRIKLLITDEGVEPDVALRQLFPTTGRALLFSFVAVFVGFGILGLSYVPPLSKLGMLIAFSVLISFISSMTVLPALIKQLKPAFLGYSKKCSVCESNERSSLEIIKQQL